MVLSYDFRFGFLSWQKVFLPGQWKNRQKLAKKTGTCKIVQKHPNLGTVINEIF